MDDRGGGLSHQAGFDGKYRLVNFYLHDKVHSLPLPVDFRRPLKDIPDDYWGKEYDIPWLNSKSFERT